MTTYWELYVAYVNRCVENNWKDDIDPHHYEMEWNHFLPRCIFGDWPIGHYLTLRQHAIASALQSLAFNRNCMCPWHKKHLPEVLLREAWPIYCKTSRERMKITNRVIHAQKDEDGKSINAIKASIASNAEKDSEGRSITAMKAGVANKLKTQKRTELTRIKDGSIFTFDSAADAARSLNLCISSISAVCRGKQKDHNGYTARYL